MTLVKVLIMNGSDNTFLTLLVSEDTQLLYIAIIILLSLVAYSIAAMVMNRPKSAKSQAESLKNMLEEYAEKVQNNECTIDEKFEFVHVDIPTKQYPKYDNSRAVDEVGLSQEEADSFVLDLIKAIEVEIPSIESAILKGDYKSIEEIVHTITGTASTLGSGGISSAFIAFYSSVQHRDGMQEEYIHLQNIKYYLNELKEDFESKKEK